MYSSRRRFLETLPMLGGAVVAAQTVWEPRAAEPAEALSSRRRCLRFAQFSDIHVGSTIPTSAAGFARALHHVQSLRDGPELILTTGDLVTDAFWASTEESLSHWKVFRHVMEQECKLPVRHCIGNHDVHGWGRGDTTSALAGKKMCLEQLGLDRTYYSFDQAGWHFVILDDIQRGGWNGFMHFIDPDQMVWLEEDLRKTPPATPVIIATHAPILGVVCFFEPPAKTHPDGLVISNDCVHTDTVKLKNLFLRHPNVKLCLSGHYHQVDRCEYLGVHYLCGGAVAGDYWRKPLLEFEAGYGLVDLFEDGSFAYRYVDYGWVGTQDRPERARYPWAKG